MKKHWESLNEWLDHRTGVHTAVRKFLYEDIPASSGWHQVFGSVAMFLILVQFFTGIMLAFNYAPTPGEAYNSLRYILTEVTAGRLMRGLHHWGASMIIVIVVLHMVQVFIWGAYKKPREATWMVGVVLLLLTLAYGLTGYLLPWDNRAYWGTVVTTQIAAMAPGLGQYATRLMGGDGAVGVVTFARFYALHVLLLPPATLALIGIHVYLVRKHGVAPAPSDEGKPNKQFYPQQVFKDTAAIFLAFALLFTLAIAVRVPLEQIADPTDTAYIPRPEWYFLFLFQTLKLFEGPLEVVGAVILPTLAMLTLILVPFLDRTRVVRVTKRTTAMAVVVFAAIGWAGLTTAAVVTTPKEAAGTEVDYSAPTGWTQLAPDEMAAVAYFRQANCASCHALSGQSGAGPDLTKTPIHKDAAWMLEHFKRPGSSKAQLTDAQYHLLSAFLLKLNESNASAMENAPEFATQGALIYQASHCGACHMVNGAGMKLGPALNGIAKRQSRSWVIGHFLDPQKLAPGTIMPPYKLSQKDLDTLTTYLFTLPDTGQ
jgi:quinol-cytochrome oxidoreductase complex cytochrome b subunit